MHATFHIDDADLPAFWCYQFVEELFANGLRHAIISPGSRSTPLALAFDVHQGFHKTVILDERSAGFTGLGIGRASGIPAALVCTSGTAAANYYPSVIEARQSGIPLLVLTCDRPPNQRYTGASQTIDQIKLYGDYPLLFQDAGEPVRQDEDLIRLAYLACQAVQLSMDRGGPVHINFPFRKPLEPGEIFLKTLGSRSEKQLKGGRLPAVQTLPSASGQPAAWPAGIIDLMAAAKRPLLIAGPRQAFHPGQEIITGLAMALKAPLLCESTSFASGSTPVVIKGYDAILRSPESRDHLKPDVIIRFGNEPVSKGIELLIHDCPDVKHVHLFENESPQNSSLSLDLRSRLPLTLPEHADFQGRGNEYLTDWQAHSDRYIRSLGKHLDCHDVLADPHVYYDLVPLIPADWNITLSNSFPVRDFDAFGLPDRHEQRVFSNRGAAGIDGITSTAIGCGLGNGKQGVLFIGDLAFLHDTNALLQASARHQTLVIVIINNRGGSIFRMLPFEEQNERFTCLFETPQQIDISALAKAHQIGFMSVGKREGLTAAFTSLTGRNGISILECITDPEISMLIRQTTWE
ncbi:MAG: 2-succinyl-5-enolpyruvyl-6-hydroxy-3-cyclohexene-1-carboxylic-acid synthase [Balneolales bacterium]